jgi:hypothetical protein
VEVADAESNKVKRISDQDPINVPKVVRAMQFNNGRKNDE